MADEHPQAPQQAPQQRGDDHVGAAANPEQHLSEVHNLSIQVQGKEGSGARTVWALIREEKGKVKTLATFEGTRREAANHFFKFIHPNRLVAPPAASHRPSRDFRQGPRTGRPQGRPQSRP